MHYPSLTVPLLLISVLMFSSCKKESTDKKESADDFSVSPTSFSLDEKNQSLEFTVKSKQEWRIEGAPDWIHHAVSYSGDTKCIIWIEENLDYEERNATIFITQADNRKLDIHISQQPTKYFTYNGIATSGEGQIYESSCMYITPNRQHVIVQVKTNVEYSIACMDTRESDPKPIEWIRLTGTKKLDGDPYTKLLSFEVNENGTKERSSYLMFKRDDSSDLDKMKVLQCSTLGVMVYRTTNNKPLPFPDKIHSNYMTSMDNQGNGFLFLKSGAPFNQIVNNLFNTFKNLQNITIPESVTKIGSSAFQGCSNLNDIVIPEKVTSIGSSAFWGCSNFKDIVIPENVTSIGSYVFVDCTGLKSITVLPETPPYTAAYPLFNGSSDVPIYVPKESVSLYKEKWSQYSSRIFPIPD